jgi:hypothetical protein
VRREWKGRATQGNQGPFVTLSEPGARLTAPCSQLGQAIETPAALLRHLSGGYNIEFSGSIHTPSQHSSRANLPDTRRMSSSGVLRRVAIVKTDVSEERSAFIRVTRFGELGITLAVTSNRVGC